MHLGVDLGTTRTIVASVDRGNYPVVSFLDGVGDAHEHFPSVVAEHDGGLVFGFEALDAAEEGAPLLRSFKRFLAAPDVGPHTTVRVGTREVPLLDVLTGFCRALREALLTRSSIRLALADEGVGATVVAVPAHAHGAQRFLTLEAFRRAGFRVTAMVNEPSAAGFEYTHRQGRTLTSRRTRVIVYDLGGGTFDASLVRVDGKSHEVLGSLGLNTLGGDDFDAILAGCAARAAGAELADLTPRERARLLQECREAKEHLSPQSKRIAIDVGDTPVVVAVADFYAAAAPLVEKTILAMHPLVGELDGDGRPELTDIAGIYLVGGASGLPLVPRLLRERFGRRVHRSPYPAASTAIGLAIAADEQAGYSLTDRLSRGFGVFREGRGGATLAFDPILTADSRVSTSEEVVVTRRYPAAHNVGWFRFVEYTSVDEFGGPRGDIVPFAEVVFPFDPALQARAGRDGGVDLRGVAVERRDGGPLVEEKYVVDTHGIVEVHLTDLSTGYRQVESLHTRA